MLHTCTPIVLCQLDHWETRLCGLHQLDYWENYEYLYKILFFYFYWGASLLEIGLHRLAPPFLNALAFIQIMCLCANVKYWIGLFLFHLTGKWHSEMPEQMTLSIKTFLSELSDLKIFFFFFNQDNDHCN